jgi:predicted nucleotidyltransferase
MRTLDDINLGANDRAAVQEAVVLLRQRFPVERVVLFGSTARGRASEQSDIDLLVLTSKPMTRRERRQITDVLFDVQLRRDVVIDTLVVSVEEWEHGLYQVLPIRAEVERDGVAA